MTSNMATSPSTWTAAALLVFCAVAPIAPVRSAAPSAQPTLAAQQPRVCSSIEVRQPQDLLALRNCSIVVGHLTITNVQLDAVALERDDLVAAVEEITDYLLVYRAENLRTLQHLLPRLTLVRGCALYQGRYSLVVFENRDLLDLGLAALLRLQRGQVRIEANPRLCFTHTLHWLALLGNHTEQPVTLKNNYSPNSCPPCDADSNEVDDYQEQQRRKSPAGRNTTRRQYCWNLSARQRFAPFETERRPQRLIQPREDDVQDGDCSAGACCSANCLTGCAANDCRLCANLRMGTKCVDRCEADYFELNKRECVKRGECYDRGGIPHAGHCLNACPAHTDRLVDAKGRVSCRLSCQGPYVVRTAADLEGLANCTTVNGSLTLELTHVQSKILDELNHAFAGLEEITGYLRVQRSPQLVYLSFLRRLRRIGGNELLDGRFVLSVVGNAHLEGIWAPNQTVSLERGEIYFHLNPRLCHNKAEALQPSLGSGRPITAINVSPNSNGERVVCGRAMTLNATIEDYNATAVRVRLEPVSAEYVDVLYGYDYHYREAPEDVSKYDGRHGCGHDNWHMDVVEGKNIRHVIGHLKPDTRYAYFVNSIARLNYHINLDASSEVQYFKTLADLPGPVARAYAESNAADELIIHWWPPRRRNGQIGKYLVAWKAVAPESVHNEASSEEWVAVGDSAKSCECPELAPERSGPAPDAGDFYNSDLQTYDDLLPNLVYVQRNVTTKAAPKAAAEEAVENTTKTATKAAAEEAVENTTTSSASRHNSTAYANYQSLRFLLDQQALLKQDNGTADFQIAKPLPICPFANANTQYQLENKCRTMKFYEGVKVAGNLYSFMVNGLQAGRTYRISLRACAEELQNGCGDEAVFYATTMDKDADIFMREIGKLGG